MGWESGYRQSPRREAAKLMGIEAEGDLSPDISAMVEGATCQDSDLVGDFSRSLRVAAEAGQSRLITIPHLVRVVHCTNWLRHDR